MTDQSALPAAGWYPDPENAASERWWNGASWSDNRRPAGSAAAAPSPYPAPSPYASSQPQYAYTPAPGYTPSPYGSPYAPAPYGSPSPTNGMALAGLITACAGIFSYGLPAIVGIVLSAIGLSQARKREAMGMPKSGRGMALAGLIVGIGLVAFYLILLVVVIVIATQSSAYYH